MANINQKITAADLQFLSVFELYLTSRFTFQTRELSIETLTSENWSQNHTTNRSSAEMKSKRRASPNLPKQVSTYSSNQLDLYRQALLGKLNDSVRNCLKGMIRFN